jgi:hypothetical protein
MLSTDNTTLQSKLNLSFHIIYTLQAVYLFQETLNSFMGLGRTAWLEARSKLQSLLSADNTTLQSNQDLRTKLASSL